MADEKKNEHSPLKTVGIRRDVLKMDANFEKYGSDDGTGGVDSLSEQRCAVCNDSECDNINSIVYCDGCNIAVHQECYTVAFIPEGSWVCRRCMVHRGSAVSCAIQWSFEAWNIMSMRADGSRGFSLRSLSVTR